MRTLVTGADGFIGSHMVERLVAQGHEVTGLTQYNSFGHAGWLELVPPSVRAKVAVESGDVRDADHVSTLIQGHDRVFHLAALIGIPYSYEAPGSYLETNVRGTLNVLEASRRHGVSRVLIASTSEVYGSAREVPIRETHLRQPQSPYSASKIAADAFALSYFFSFGVPVTIFRPFNTYGPRQSLRAVIPTIISQLLSGERTLQLGNLHTTRDFTFVADTVRGIEMVASSADTVGEELNLCSGKEISIRDLVDEICGVMDIDPSEIQISQGQNRVRPSESEVLRLLGDGEKAKRLAQWEAEVTLREGLSETVSWFREAQAGPLFGDQRARDYHT